MARLRGGCGAQSYNEGMNDYASSAHAQPLARTVLPIAVLTILWGCNWPMLKMGVTEMAPLTFRAVTLPFAALGLLLVAWLSGDNVRIPREWWTKVAVLAAFNIAGWNSFVLFGVQQMPAGRSVILAFTMPIWATLIASVVLHERLSRRKLAGLLLGMCGIALLIGDEIRVIQQAPFGAVMILIAAISWGIGTVLLRKWAPAVPLTTLTGWMMLAGWLPLAALAPFFDSQPLTQSLASTVGTGLDGGVLQHRSCRHHRALGVVQHGAHASRRGVVAFVAAGAHRGRVRRHAAAARAPGPVGMAGPRTRRVRVVRGAVRAA